MNSKKTFTATRWRHFNACVLTLIAAVVMIPGMTTYIPFQESEQIVLPIMLFPIIWPILFIYSYMAEKAWHPFVLMMLVIITHALFSYFALTGSST